MREGNNTTLQILLLIFYVLLIVWGIANHEQWRDEAQAWLIVRDADFTELFKILRTEGHPPLWYLLIMPLAKSGLPYISQNVLTLVIMASAVYILLFKTRLPLLVKILLPFSYFFIYEYAFFARSYCLIPFFVAAIISLYPRRFEKPWLYALCIVGLFNTHVLVFTFCGMLMLVYAWELFREKRYSNPQQAGATALMAIGGGYLLPYLFMAKMADEFDKGIEDNLARMISSIDAGLIISQNEIFALIILLATAVLLIRQPKALAILLGGLVSVLYVLGYKYSSAALRHQGIIFFVVLTAAVVAYFESKDSEQKPAGKFNAGYAIWALVAMCVLQLKPAFSYYQNDNTNIFSGAKDAATFLQDNDLEHRILVGHQAWAASALLPFMDESVKMYYGECGRYGTYYIYDSCFINDKWMHPVDKSVDAAYDNFKDKLDSVVMVFNYPVNAQAERFLDLIYATPEQPIRIDEAFYIYKFKEGLK